jgi:hypothetical protein
MAAPPDQASTPRRAMPPPAFFGAAGASVCVGVERWEDGAGHETGKTHRRGLFTRRSLTLQNFTTSTRVVGHMTHPARRDRRRSERGGAGERDIQESLDYGNCSDTAPRRKRPPQKPTESRAWGGVGGDGAAKVGDLQGGRRSPPTLTAHGKAMTLFLRKICACLPQQLTAFAQWGDCPTPFWRLPSMAKF